MSNNFDLDQEIKSRGYLNFKIITNESYFYKIKEDDTLIEIKIAVDSILDDPLNPVGILSGAQSVVCFSTLESRKTDVITQNQDLESTLIHPGKFILKIGNKTTIEVQPSIGQIVRTGRKLAGGSPEYLITLLNKQFINKL